MTPGTRLLEAARASTRNPSPRENLTERECELLDATEALSGARALYPAAHAIGDRVSVVYPDERKPDYEDFTGTVVGVEFTGTGVDYRVKGDGDPGYSVVEARFVRAAPSCMESSAPASQTATVGEAHPRVHGPRKAAYAGPPPVRPTVSDEARAFDPFDESFSDEARIGGERALNLFADMLEARDTHITSPNYEGAARFLWQLLDDISTLDDACRDNDAAFRTHACAIVEKRGRVAASFDGQTLHFVGSEGWTRGMVQPTGDATYVVPGVRVVESPHVTGAFLINTASPAAQEAMVAGLRDIAARETSVVASLLNAPREAMRDATTASLHPCPECGTPPHLPHQPFCPVGRSQW